MLTFIFSRKGEVVALSSVENRKRDGEREEGADSLGSTEQEVRDGKIRMESIQSK